MYAVPSLEVMHLATAKNLIFEHSTAPPLDRVNTRGCKGTR
jgi:hypothetical protein